MAAPRRVIELAIGLQDLARLARSRAGPASRVERARIVLAYRAEPSSRAVAAHAGVTHHTVQRCLRRAIRLGVMAALDDSPRPGKAARITAEAKAWLVPLACQKAVFTPKHGSWLNLVEGVFSTMARSVLRPIRVASKAELTARILAYFNLLNQDPTVPTWTYKLDQAA